MVLQVISYAENILNVRNMKVVSQAHNKGKSQYTENCSAGAICGKSVGFPYTFHIFHDV